MRITEDDFKNWWSSPVGVEVKSMLTERQNTIAHKTGSGGVLGLEDYHVHVGRYKEIKDLLDMNFKELMGEE